MGVRWGGRVMAAGIAMLAFGGAVGVASAGNAKPRTDAAAHAMMRPTQAKAWLHYNVHEAKPFVSRFVVVHYVRSGIDAPPLNDDDHNGIPDYVEIAARAGDRSILFFGHRGFKAPVPDRAGPNRTIDLYVKKLPAGIAGLTIPTPEKRGGAWIAIAPNLDRVVAGAEVGLADTVTHELFHVVQFSYLPEGIPRWAGEGSASGAALTLDRRPDMAQIGAIDTWLAEPWRSLYDARFGCDHCYGGALWWGFLLQAPGHVVPQYLGRLYGYVHSGKKVGQGLQPLDETLQRYAHTNLYRAFTMFSLMLYREGAPVRSLYSVRPTRVVRRTQIRNVQGLSTHYVPIVAGPRARGFEVAIVTGGGPAPAVTLVVGGPRGRIVRGTPLGGKTAGAVFRVHFRNAKEKRAAMLVITSGRAKDVRYRLADRALYR